MSDGREKIRFELCTPLSNSLLDLMRPEPEVCGMYVDSILNPRFSGGYRRTIAEAISGIEYCLRVWGVLDMSNRVAIRQKKIV